MAFRKMRSRFRNILGRVRSRRSSRRLKRMQRYQNNRTIIAATRGINSRPLRKARRRAKRQNFMFMNGKLFWLVVPAIGLLYFLVPTIRQKINSLFGK